LGEFVPTSCQRHSSIRAGRLAKRRSNNPGSDKSNMRVSRNHFRSSDRWLLAEYVRGLLGHPRSTNFEGESCAFSNAFHVFDPPVFYIRSRAVLSLATISQLQLLLVSIPTIQSVAFAFWDELLQPDGGCRVTADSIVSWQGQPFAATAPTEGAQPVVLPSPDLSDRIQEIQSAPKAVDLVHADFWQEIVERIQPVLTCADFPGQTFSVLPHVDDIQAVVVAVSGPNQLSGQLRLELARLMWGLNPWEVWIATNERAPRLIEAISADQTAPDFWAGHMLEPTRTGTE
jgi:hypothetical protein